MKKKILSLLVLLLTAATGAWAEEVTIGDPNATTGNSYLPSYSLYDYSLTQQIYTADEIGMGGTITALTMWLQNTSSYARNFKIYMKEVDMSAFATNTDWVSMTDDDLVATGTLSNGIGVFGQTTFTLTNPFEYSGEGSLVICFTDVTGNWSSGAYSNTMVANGNQAMYVYRDSNPYDVTTPGVNGTFLGVKSVVRLNIEPAAAGFTLTEGTNEHGTLTCKVGDKVVTTAEEGDEVTVVIEPEEGWVPSKLTARPYLTYADAHVRRNIPGEGTAIDIVQPIEAEFTESTVGDKTVYTATFTMLKANTLLDVDHKKLLTNADITIEPVADQTYTGKAIEPELIVKDGSTVLVAGTDYELTFTNNTTAAASTAENAPTVTITAATASELYAGETSVTFTINPATLTADMIAAIDDQTFTGSEVTPALTITFGEGADAQTLVLDTDFTVVYSDNTENGEATATATGKGNFTGTASVKFNILQKELSDDMIQPIDNVIYSREELEPALTVKYGDQTLVEGEDFTAEYSDNVESGTATVVLTGIGNYTGTATATFFIGRKDLNSADITVDYIFQEVYDGSEHTPMMFVRHRGGLMLEGRDFKVAYRENINAGSARVTIDGIGNYTGRIKKYFNIKSYVLDVDMVQAIADQTWTGEAVTPAVSVINGNVTLVEGRDYTVKFKNNVNEGTATVIVNGTGNFRSVDLVTTFKIVKKPEVVQPEVEAPGEDTATAIDAPATAAQPAGKTFDLQGREATATKKGVVIVDGKLVLKK